MQTGGGAEYEEPWRLNLVLVDLEARAIHVDDQLLAVRRDIERIHARHALAGRLEVRAKYLLSRPQVDPRDAAGPVDKYVGHLPVRRGDYDTHIIMGVGYREIRHHFLLARIDDKEMIGLRARNDESVPRVS